MMGVIARRELIGLLQGPLLWLLLAAQQGILTWVMLRILERFSLLDSTRTGAGLSQELSLNLYGMAGAIALFSVPLLALRMLTEERRHGAHLLLAAAPLSPTTILGGKLFGLLPVLLLLAAQPLLLCLSLLPWVSLDLGLLAAATLGLLLVNLSCASIGLFAASLSRQPAAAIAIAYGLLIALSVLGQSGLANNAAALVFNWLTWNEHFLPFLLGMVQTPDMAYFLILSGLFLSLGLRRLQQRIHQA